MELDAIINYNSPIVPKSLHLSALMTLDAPATLFKPVLVTAILLLLLRPREGRRWKKSPPVLAVGLAVLLMSLATEHAVSVGWCSLACVASGFAILSVRFRWGSN